MKCLPIAVVALSLALSPATSLFGQTRAAEVPFDVADVFVQRSTYAWIEKQWVLPSAYVSGDHSAQDSVDYEFVQVLHGKPIPGTVALIGHLAHDLPPAGEIKAERYERKGNEISLVFRYGEHRPTADETKAGVWSGYFHAPLPPDLPAGTYKVSVAIHNLPDKTARNSFDTTFDNPDPETKRIATAYKSLEKLPLEQWIDRYREAAAEATGLSIPRDADPRNYGLIAREVIYARTALVHQMKAWMIIRKFEISPHLIEALKVECRRNPEPKAGDEGPPPGISAELMEMLLRIGDTRAAPLLADIVAGKTNSNTFVRRSALETLEKLTYIRFRRRSSGHGDTESVCTQDAVEWPYIRDLSHEAALYGPIGEKYRTWLAANPTAKDDRSPWLKAAAERAGGWLKNENLDGAFVAAEFLRGGNGGNPHHPSDDDQATTTALIAAILEKCEPVREKDDDRNKHKKSSLQYRHVPSGKPLELGAWMRPFVGWSTLPERYAPLLIRFSRDDTQKPGHLAEQLSHVAGKEAMAYRMELYRRLAPPFVARGIDLRDDYMKDFHKQYTEEEDKQRWEVWHTQLLRIGIERWAGRVFQTEAEIEAWWAASKDRTQREWLEDNLSLLAAQADAGNGRAQHLFREVIEDSLPKLDDPYRTSWNAPNSFGAGPPRLEPGPAFRVKWLADHRAELQYDAERGVFRLPKPASTPK